MLVGTTLGASGENEGRVTPFVCRPCSRHFAGESSRTRDYPKRAWHVGNDDCVAAGALSRLFHVEPDVFSTFPRGRSDPAIEYRLRDKRAGMEPADRSVGADRTVATKGGCARRRRSEIPLLGGVEQAQSIRGVRRPLAHTREQAGRGIVRFAGKRERCDRIVEALGRGRLMSFTSYWFGSQRRVGALHGSRLTRAVRTVTCAGPTSWICAQKVRVGWSAAIVPMRCVRQVP